MERKHDSQFELLDYRNRLVPGGQWGAKTGKQGTVKSKLLELCGNSKVTLVMWGTIKLCGSNAGKEDEVVHV